MSFNITQASREQLVGSIALMGASGSGKTLSSLKVAKGMMDAKYKDTITDEEKWKKIGYVDTEHERSKIYANNSNHGIGAFSHIDFQKPYTLDRYDDAVEALKKHGCEVVITDSLSHFWDGEGGILDLQQSFGGNFQAWRDTNPHYEAFVSLVTGERHKLDMINCMRTKQDYAVSTNDVGKLKVEKLGLKPVQRDSLEYEFHIVFQIDMNHQATTVKDNSEIFKGTAFQIDTSVGEKIHAWLKEGKDVFAEQKEAEAKEMAKKQELITEILSYRESEYDSVKDYVEKTVKKTEKKVGDLSNLPLKRLEGFVTLVVNKEKEAIEYGKETAEKMEKASEEVRKGLMETAKSFKIKGYTKMNVQELQEAIKKAQKA